MDIRRNFTYSRTWSCILVSLLFLLLFSSCNGDSNNSQVIINSEKDLVSFAKLLREGKFVDSKGASIYKIVRLNKDIELTKPFEPIGDQEHPFFGYFDGKDHIIRNLSIHSDSSSTIALFGYVRDSHIKNLELDGVDVRGNSNVGGICGYAYSTIFMNCTVSGKIEGKNNVGGVVGDVSYCTIDDCRFDGNVIASGYSVGGVAGSFEYGAVMRCSAAGYVSGDCGVNGLVGSLSECLLIESESRAEVKYNRLSVNDFDKISKLLFSSL